MIDGQPGGWADELKGTGIRVNVLSPGATATELAKSALGEEGQKAYAAMTPLQRMADPAEQGAVATDIGGLAEQLGFAPVNLGGLSEGGMLVQAQGKVWGRLIFKDLIKPD